MCSKISINIVKGISTNDSIGFASNSILATAKLNKENIIQVQLYSPKNKIKYPKLHMLYKFYRKYEYVFLILFSLLTLGLNKYLKTFLSTFYCFITLYLSLITFHNSSDDKITKNHAAEHMTLTAYEKVNQIPTISEVENCSMYHINCGCRFTGIYIFLFIISIFIGYRIPIITLSYILSNIKIFKYLGFPIQYLITKKPDKININLAISALENVISYTELKND